MAGISAGRLYFALLGAAAVASFLIALRGIGPLSGASTGLALGFLLGEAIALVAFPVFLSLFHVSIESKLRTSVLLGILARKRMLGEVKEMREARSVRIVRSVPLLSKLAEGVERSIRSDVVKGGMQLDPYAFAARYSFYSVVLAGIFVPVALVLSVLVNPTLLALMAVPAVILYTPSMTVKNRVSERRANIRDELPFFALLASIMQSSGRSLFDAFKETAGRQILPAMEVEAKLIQRSVGFGKEVVRALDDLASTHPDDAFKHFLYGYTGVLKSGGDVVLYLSDRTREYLASMRFRWQSYAERVGTIGEMLIIVFVLLPLLLVVGAVTMPPETVATLSYAGVAALPLIAFVMYFLVRAAQPRTYDILSGDMRLGFVGLAAGALAASVTTQLWLVIAVSGAVGAALYGLPVRAQMREVRMTENALPDFLRSIAEYRKIGYNMRKAVLETAANAKFNPVFDSILAKIAAQMNLGVKLGEVRIVMRSWLGRMTLFILDQITESGGGTPANVEDLYSFISSYNRLRREATSSVSLYRMLGYAVPVAIPAVVKVISGVIGSFGSSTAGFFGGGTASLAIVNGAVSVITVVAAGAIAFTMTRATDFTAKNTLNMTILFALAVLAIMFTQYLPSISFGF